MTQHVRVLTDDLDGAFGRFTEDYSDRFERCVYPHGVRLRDGDCVLVDAAHVCALPTSIGDVIVRAITLDEFAVDLSLGVGRGLCYLVPCAATRRCPVCGGWSGDLDGQTVGSHYPGCRADPEAPV
ncbi:MAG: hypothetical protein QM811_25645 [Pirellulales bacterium]